MFAMQAWCLPVSPPQFQLARWAHETDGRIHKMSRMSPGGQQNSRSVQPGG